jgi:hypothetical protein
MKIQIMFRTTTPGNLNIQSPFRDIGRNDFNSKSTRIPFDPGIYTVVAGDEWGNLVILHFTVAR